MNLQLAELEIDDVAFLTGSESHPPRKTDLTCSSFCTPTPGRRYSKTNCGSMLLATVFFSTIVIIALLLAFLNPFKERCSGNPKQNALLSDSDDHHSQFVATNGESFPWRDIRLPTFIKPLHYDLFMHPNLTTFLNKGSVEITLQVTAKTDFLVIHVKSLNISEVSLEDSQGKLIKIIKTLEYAHFEQLFLRLAVFIYPQNNNFTLKMKFAKELEERLEGFYLSSYIDAAGDRRRYLATTHFEPTSARSAFPCFDEPALKATFSLKMVHDAHHDVFFNADQQTKLVYNKEGHLLSVFDQTVPMSTYLVAFIVCDFKSISARTKEGVHVRVLVPNDQYNQADYALYAATSILSYYQEFFNVTYPLTKLDLVAVPDFGAGAMENWGLITFRTTMILFNEQSSSSEVQEQVSVVISHELAHQWFGNLVTMNWWNDLWLNEGFASYVENLGVEHLHPEWNMIDQFVLTTTQEALALDSLESSHPIMANVTDPREIEAMFDAISYKKGASLIRMLQNFLSTDVLRLGLHLYLSKYQYRNAKTEDLWRSLSDVVPNSSINVTAVMEGWVEQKGFPLISVKSDKSKIYIRQSKFLSSPTDSKDYFNARSQWIIPITLITSRNYVAHRLVWLTASNTAVTLDYGAEWFKLNVNQTGYYRVNYDERNWYMLIQVLQRSDPHHHMLTATDRANLIDDAFALLKSGLLSADISMNLTSYLETGERDYVPWETALVHFNTLDALMNGHPDLHRYIRKLLQPVLTVWGWKDEGSHLTRKLRSSLLYTAMSFEDEPTIRIARRFFDEWVKNNYKVSPNVRQTVYTTGVRFGGVKEWNFCWEKYEKTKIPSEQRLLLKALSQTRIPWLLDRFLNFSLDREKIKRQDTVQIITDVARNPLGKLLVWRFVRENWDTILSLFGKGSFSMDSIITETTWHFTSPFDLKEVEDFFKTVEVGSGTLAVKQCLERIRANIFWKNHVENHVIIWLQKIRYRS